jgi:putative peptidoglycan lipid II flippase
MSRVIERIRRRLAEADSQHRRIASGFLWVSMFVLVGRLAGAAKEMAIAWRYGVSATVDAYVFLYNLITWPVSVWFSVLTVVLVPLIAHASKADPKNLPRFRAELLALTLLAGVALALLAAIGLPRFLETGWAGLHGAAVQQALAMAAPLALTLPLGLVVSLFSVWMLASGRHGNTLLEAVPAFTLLILLLLPPTWVPDPLVWGTVAGLAFQMFGLGVPLRRSGELQAPVLGLRSPAWQLFWGSIGVLSIGQLLSSLTGIIDQFFAAGLNQGALSTLGYANRILALIQGMGAVAIARSTLPVFSMERAQHGRDINALALRWAQIMFVGGLAMAACCALVAPILVALLFERGAFTPENTRAVVNVFSFSLLQVPFYFAALVLVSALASARRYSLIALSGMFNLLVKLIFAYLLVGRFQLIGLVLSTAAMYAFSLLLLYVAVVRVARWDRLQEVPQ